MFWYVLPICKGSLTSLLHIDSCWVYFILRSLTSLLYVIHVCRGGFTSPLMHYILYFMWVRALSSLLHVMHVCRGANFTSLSSWMYIAYISLFLICFILPLYWWLTKREKDFEFLYAYLSVCIYWVYAFYVFTKWGECFWKFKQKGGEGFWEKELLVYACFSHLIDAYIFV